jgi:hypothetical protein
MRGDMTPTLVGRFWHWPDGTILPVVSGGSDAGPTGEPAGDPGTTPPPEPKLLAQDEVDRIVEQRLARERAKFSDYDTLKARAAKADELEAANATETEKAIAKATKDATDAVTKVERDKANQRIVRAEIKALAGTKLQDPNDAVRLLDLTSFTVDDDGNVDEDAVKAAIDELLKTKPYLAADGGGKGSGKMPNLGQGDRGTTKAAPSVETGRALYAERHAKRGGTKTT